MTIWIYFKHNIAINIKETKPKLDNKKVITKF